MIMYSHSNILLSLLSLLLFSLMPTVYSQLCYMNNDCSSCVTQSCVWCSSTGSQNSGTCMSYGDSCLEYQYVTCSNNDVNPFPIWATTLIVSGCCLCILIACGLCCGGILRSGKRRSNQANYHHHHYDDYNNTQQPQIYVTSTPAYSGVPTASLYQQPYYQQPGMMVAPGGYGAILSGPVSPIVSYPQPIIDNNIEPSAPFQNQSNVN